MAKKTNTTINNKSYYRVTATVGKKPDGSPLRKQFYGESKKEAEAKRDKYLNKINKGLDAGFDKITLGDYFYRWLFNVKKQSIKDSSFERYECIYRLKIKPSNIFNMELVNIRSIHIQELCTKVFNETNSQQAVDKLLKLLSNFFDYCIKEDVIIKNPCKNIAKPQNQDVKEEEMLFFDKEERIEISMYSMRNIKYFIYYFALHTGLRQGEILALTYKDVDFENKMISVVKAVKQVTVVTESDRVYTSNTLKPKTPSSVRKVPMSDETVLHLKRHCNYEKEKHLKQGIPFSESNLLFTNDCCKSKDARNTLRIFERMLKRLGIGYKNFHCLRHTFCSMLAENGVSLKTASVLMGHSNINTTAKIYTHITDDEKRKAIDSLVTTNQSPK